jgi:hypothetical protein
LSARRRVLLRFERELWARGIVRIAGVDEVGVGPLAGPLIAAAVILPPEVSLRGIDDSKKLSRPVRTRLSDAIKAVAVGVGLGVVTPEEVDRLNTFWAAIEAMRRAIAALPEPAEHLLLDARRIPELALPQDAIIKGDRRSYSIAAASIIAKVTRDEDGCARSPLPTVRLCPPHGLRHPRAPRCARPVWAVPDPSSIVHSGQSGAAAGPLISLGATRRRGGAHIRL